MFYRAWFTRDDGHTVLVADAEDDLAFVETAATDYAALHGVTITTEQSTNGIAWEEVA